MNSSDLQPLANTPATARIVRHANNRLGAVYSALYSFWSDRSAAVTIGSQATPRRDAYSVILFGDDVSTAVTNNFTSSPDQLLDAVLPYRIAGGTNFTIALRSAQTVMEQNFNTERYVEALEDMSTATTHFMKRTPVIIFLSDGESSINDQTVQDLCRSAVHLGSVYFSFYSMPH